MARLAASPSLRFAPHPRAPQARQAPRVVVVGGGTAGMGAARRLVDAGCHVTLVEAAGRLGGDCFGVDVPLPGGGTYRVDVGVSDFNVDTFVEIRQLLDDLGLQYAPICQDASFMTPDRAPTLASTDGELRALDPSIDVAALRGEIQRFNRECVAAIDDPACADWTLGRYLAAHGHSAAVAQHYLYPRTMGCFSMPDADPADAPLVSLLRFWRMHGLVGRGPARRMSVVGGMHAYCDALQRRLVARGTDVWCGARVIGIVRRPGDVEVRVVTREDEHLTLLADHVVVATNPNEALPLLEDPSAAEEAAFGGIPFSRARLVVHTDARVMPPDPTTWGAYNYVVAQGDAPRVRPTITFFPNRMLHLPTHVPDVFVTMNPCIEPASDQVITQRFFEHPVASFETRRAARHIDALEGARRTWFCGSYLAEPFLHEQAHASGLRIADRLLASLRPAAVESAGAHRSRAPYSLRMSTVA